MVALDVQRRTILQFVVPFTVSFPLKGLFQLRAFLDGTGPYERMELSDSETRRPTP